MLLKIEICKKSIADRNAKKVSVLKKHFNKQKLEIEQFEQAIEEGVRNQKIIFYLSLFFVLLLMVSHFLN
jgi:hypothetical protein